ncbi:hypothetical protein GGS26DRAFT_555035 [Hypomontagnella submonticulosa]|nr:hypothetical protein GGS26DRAFT_555035 [Hypomontagnella submonticulosa]
MAFNSGSVFSETLQEITNTKLEELSKRRSDFETAKSNILSMLEIESDPAQRLYILSQGVKTCYALKLGKYGRVHNATQSRNSELELELKNLDCFLAQVKYDPSVINMTPAWEESMLRHLNTQSLKYEYASLYAQLVTEWLSTEKPSESEEVDIAMAEGFEDVADTMKQDARQQWERSVFEPAKVDEDGLRTYLGNLFSAQGAEASAKSKALDRIRSQVATFESAMSTPNQFSLDTLKWAIDGLLSSGLLSDEKREVLRDFKNNSIILSEIVDVLNMRIASLQSWSWGQTVHLEQRRQINGVYNILMHEDLIQAIFLQHIGVKWSVFFKRTFREFQKTPGAWKSGWKAIPKIDAQRRSYYLGIEKNRKSSVQYIRNTTYRKHYFMAQLMDNELQHSEIADGEEEADYLENSSYVAQQRAPPAAPAARKLAQGRNMALPPAPAFGMPSMSMSRPVQHESPYDEPNDDDTSGWDSADSTKRRPMDSKQRLLRLLATEIVINTKLYGEITAFHSMFERWYTLLPHETILTVLSFFGVSTTWLNFFTKFLKAPLKFLEDDPSTPSRNRSRGTPASHVLSDVFGESILFCLDLAVNQSTGGNVLFRMQEDFWFWSRDHSAAVTAWKSVNEFVKATGTYINLPKTGTTRISQDPEVSLEIDRSLPVGDIRWGFLRLSRTGQFEIDQHMVDKHILDLRKQLQDKQKSIISFIQAWNTYVSTFFTSNFGKAANCFGRNHVAQMLATHQRIQREIFSASSPLTSGSEHKHNVTQNIIYYLKSLIKERFGIDDIPDAYFYFPVELGGLDLNNPFIPILQVHNTVLPNPAETMDAFFKSEKEAYESCKATFEKGTLIRYPSHILGWEPESKKDREEFMSFNEYVRYREDVGYGSDYTLYAVYVQLLKIPEEDGVQTPSAKVNNGITSLQVQGTALRGITGNWSAMEPYWKWVAELYGPKVVDRFGSLNIVEPGLLPIGMVSIFRDKRVKWQG